MNEEYITKLMSIKEGECALLNGKFRCTFKNIDGLCKSFSEWHKDNNSPSFFSDAYVAIDEDGEKIDGMISIQHDEKLSEKYYMLLCTKGPDSSQWQHMYTINSCELKL